MRRHRLLQLSGIIVDLAYEVEAVPPAGGEALVRGFAIHPGGGFNAMAAASRQGMHVSYGANLGTGPFASLTASALAQENIQTVRPPVSHMDQGNSVVLTDAAAERTMIAQEGAEGLMSRQDLEKIPLEQFDWWLLSGYQLSYPGSRHALEAWLQDLPDEPPLVFDPSPALGQIDPHALALVMRKALWISASRQEAAILSGLDDPNEAAQALVSARPRTDGGVVVRDAANGCFIGQRPGLTVHVPGYDVIAIDTNGAGDTHIGSFIAGLARGLDAKEAAASANKAAAISTTRKGPASSPGLNELG